MRILDRSRLLIMSLVSLGGCAIQLEPSSFDREAIQRHDKVFSEASCSICPVLVEVPGGEFVRNVPGIEFAGETAKVRVKSFKAGKFRVTQQQWLAVMGYLPGQEDYRNGPDAPFTGGLSTDIDMYVEKLNAKTGRKYRLISSNEWEYLARSGDAWAVVKPVSTCPGVASRAATRQLPQVNQPDLEPTRARSMKDMSVTGVLRELSLMHQSDVAATPQKVEVKRPGPNTYGVADLVGYRGEVVSDQVSPVGYRGFTLDERPWLNPAIPMVAYPPKRVMRGGSRPDVDEKANRAKGCPEITQEGGVDVSFAMGNFRLAESY